MALSIDFVVHSVNVNAVMTTVQHEGVDVRAAVDACEVEFVSTNGRHGSFVARFTGPEAVEAKSRFKAGDAVKWSI